MSRISPLPLNGGGGLWPAMGNRWPAVGASWPWLGMGWEIGTGNGMPKYPSMQWYIGDWMKDPLVGMMGPLSRGVWFDWINTMHELDRCGQLTGTRDQLARVGRCTPDEVDATLAELRSTKAGDVSTDGHGVVTLTNRRMRREYESRINALNRKRNERGQPPVLPSVTGGKGGCHNDVTEKSRAPSSSSSSISSSSSSPADEQNSVEKIADDEANARTFATNWISKECFSFLKPSCTKPFARLILCVGKERAISEVQRVMEDSEVGNPFAYALAMHDGEKLKQQRTPRRSAVAVREDR